MEKEMGISDGNSNQNDEDVEKGQVEGGRCNSGVRNGTSNMELEEDQLPELLLDTAGAAGIAHTSNAAKSTPALTGQCKMPLQMSEKVVILVFASIETGKQFMLLEARARLCRDQVIGSTAMKAKQIHAECKKVQAVTYKV